MSKILRTIDMDLSPQSINNAIREISAFQRQLRDQCEDLVKNLVAQGIEIAKMQVISMDALFTGFTEQSIQGVYFAEERCGIIYSDVPQALFVEYGTGYVGAGKTGFETYPGTYASGYKPDEMGHGSKGWWYPAPWGWYIPKKGKGKGVTFAWTRGMPARPFMYNTLRMLEEVAEKEGIRMFSQM